MLNERVIKGHMISESASPLPSVAKAGTYQQSAHSVAEDGLSDPLVKGQVGQVARCEGASQRRSPQGHHFLTRSSQVAFTSGAVMGTAVERSALLDMSKPIDVPLLDTTVTAFYGAGSNEEVCRTSADS